MANEISKYVSQSLCSIGKQDNIFETLNQKGSVEVSIYKPVVFSDDVSVMEQEKQCYHAEITKEIAKLSVMFPMKKDEMRNQSYWSILYTLIEEKGMPARQVRDAIHNLISTNQYQSFVPSQILSYDKRITFGRSIGHLFERLNKRLEYTELAVVKMIDGEYGEYRAYTRLVDAQDIMPERIVGIWDDDKHWWNWVGTINATKLINARTEAFKEETYKFCDCPPKWRGNYKPSIVKEFAEKYTKVVPPGDIMLFETLHNWDMEYMLEQFVKEKNVELCTKQLEK